MYMKHDYISTPLALRALAERLAGVPLLGADTEAAGYHRYLDRISLLQLSTREENFLIDPIAISDLSPLGRVFADPATEVVFHDADYDLRILHRDLDIAVHGLFDTQIAAAFLGERALGLGPIAEKYLQVTLPKAYQRADWAERPLSDGMLEYAATDTAYLPALRDRLREALIAKGRLQWAEEEFRRREGTRWSQDEADSRESFMRIKGARDLPPRGLAILRELHSWREEVARHRDQATFRVVGNQPLLEMSARPPATRAALASISGVGDSIVRRHSGEILAAVERGLGLPEEELPRFPPARRWDRDPEADQRTEWLKEVRNRRAEELELDPGFLMSRSVLEELARRNPRDIVELREIAEVRDWQVEALGEELLRALR
jgi:ribonuclease D